MGVSCVHLGTDTGPSADRRPLRRARSPEGRAGRFHDRGRAWPPELVMREQLKWRDRHLQKFARAFRPFQELLHCGEMRLGLRPSSSVAWSRSCVTEIPMCRSVGQIVEGVAAFLQKAMALPKSLGCRSGNAMAGNTPWRPFQNCLWRQARKATRSRAPGNDASGRQQRPAGV